MLDNYIEETKPLFKLLRTEAFRFVIVRYNHIKYVRQVQNDLTEKFSDRPSKTLNCSELTYEKLMEAYFSLEKGFLFLEDFGSLLNEEKTVPGRITYNGNRKSSLLEGLNRRRDKLAQYPIALFIFVPATFGTLYARKIMERIPDLWSFRSMILDIKGDFEKLRELTTVSEPSETEKADLENKKKEKQKELEYLLKQLNKTPDDEIQYKLTLYPQIVEIQKFLEKYEDALLTYEEWEKNTKVSQGYGLYVDDFLNYKADILLNLEKFDELTSEYNNWIEDLESDIKNSSVKLPHKEDNFDESAPTIEQSGLSKEEINNILNNYYDVRQDAVCLENCYLGLARLELVKENFTISIVKLEKANDLLINHTAAFDEGMSFLIYRNYFDIALNYQHLDNQELLIFNLKKSAEHLEKLVESNHDNEQYQVQLEYMYDVIKHLEGSDNSIT